jgi:hypothetical protein
MIRFRFQKQKDLPAFNLFWYDGGMKPFIPDELEEDKESIQGEGMMFVGDKGKIIASFHGDDPKIIPKKKMRSYTGPKEVSRADRSRRSNTWVRAIKTNTESSGSFLRAGCVTETINLGAVALRAGQKVDYDTENMKITNIEEANKYLSREYRKGWEL